MTRRRTTLLGALALALATTSCSALEPARDAVAGPTEGAVTGGTLTIGITPPGPIDPMSTTTTAGRLVAATLCDTLLTRDPETNQLREGIASTWVPASDGSFVTVRPLHDVRFSDGSGVLMAKDIAATLRQVVAPVNDSPYADLAKPFTSGVISTDQQQRESRPAELLVEAAADQQDLAQPLNDYDVQMRSSVANGTTAAVLAETALAPISREAFERDPAAFRADPVCVGPYRLETPFTGSEQVISLVRSADYFAQHLGYTNGGAGYADRIEFHVYATSAEVDAAYAAGEVDIAQVLPVGGEVAPTPTDEDMDKLAEIEGLVGINALIALENEVGPDELMTMLSTMSAQEIVDRITELGLDAPAEGSTEVGTPGDGGNGSGSSDGGSSSGGIGEWTEEDLAQYDALEGLIGKDFMKALEELIGPEAVVALLREHGAEGLVEQLDVTPAEELAASVGMAPPEKGSAEEGTGFGNGWSQEDFDLYEQWDALVGIDEAMALEAEIGAHTVLALLKEHGPEGLLELVETTSPEELLASVEGATPPAGDPGAAPEEPTAPQAGAVFEPPVEPADLVRGTPSGVEYVGIGRQPDGDWNHAVVRRAVSMVLDRRALAEMFGPLAEPATGHLPPSLEVLAGRRGRDDAAGLTVPSCASGLLPAEPDVEGARALLADAGIDLEGKALELTVGHGPGDTVVPAYAEAVAQQVRDALGVEIKVLPLEWQYYAPSYLDSGMGMGGMFRTGWASSTIAPRPTYNDPGQFLGAMFSDAGSEAGNVLQWSDPELEQVLRDLAGTDEMGDRSQLVAHASEVLCAQMPYVPTLFTSPAWRVRSAEIGSARGDLMTGTDGQLLLRELFVREPGD